MKTAINYRSNVLEKSPVLLEKGDVFFVLDSRGETASHFVIRMAQKITGSACPEVVHVGIALDSENTIEMNRAGIGHFTPDEVHGQKIVVFRFEDKKVSNLAADLAYNMEATYLAKHHPQLNASRLRMRYGFVNAMKSCFNHSSEMNGDQQDELEQLVDDFNFKNTLYCSEFVVLLFSMSRLILEKSGEMPSVPLACNLHLTNPSQLYEHLSDRADWECIELPVQRSSSAVNASIFSRLFRRAAANDAHFDQPAPRGYTLLP